MTDHTESIATIQRLLGSIDAWRDQAVLACAVNPTLWIAVQGVSLTEYLARLDDLETGYREVLKKLQPEGEVA